MGYSIETFDLIVRAAKLPDVPTNVITTISIDKVVISWTAPYNGGSSTTAYSITIQHSDGVTYSEDLVNCDGSDQLIVSSN